MTGLGLAISGALIHFAWQGGIIGGSLWIVLYSLRQRSASARYLVSCAALLLMALMPLVTTSVLYFRTAAATSRSVAVNIAQSSAVVASPLPASAALWLEYLQAFALPLWSIGVLVFSMRLILGYTHAFSLRRRGKVAGEHVMEVVRRLTRIMGVHRPVRVLISSMADSPSVVGWLRPVILLPAATLMGLTPLQLEAILAHEIGHIKRYDYLINILQMLVETLLFYHPAVWWTSKRIRFERELCCDDLAVRFSGNALRYARALTTLEKVRLRVPTVAMASTGGPLLYRIQRLVGVTQSEYGTSRLPAALAIGLGLLAFASNVSWVRGQDAPGVKVDLGASSVIHRTPVTYPEAAKKQGITGTVQLEVKLDSAGEVVDAHVLSGPDELRKGALESVLKWHFTSDAARGTRLISIAFSEQGTQVQVAEPRIAVFKEQQFALSEEVKAEVARRAQELGQAADEAKKAEILARRRQMERDMGAIQQQLQVEGANRSELEVKLDELKKIFLATPFPSSREGNGRVVGRAIQRINTPGMEDSVRNDLIRRLPLREGDVLSSQTLEQTMAAIRSYDEHLRVQFLMIDDGQAELRIITPR